LATDNDYGQLPLHKALRRRVDAALSLPTTGLSHGVCDTLQRAVDTVCETDLSREWADLFVTMTRHTEAGGDRPERVLELARATRALIDRVRNEPSPVIARELCADAVVAQAGGPPVDVVRLLHRWIDLPEGRLVLQAYAEYEELCRRSRTSAVEVRRALAGLVAACEDPGRQTRAHVLAETVRTAGEFGVPPIELSLEIRGLAAIPFDTAVPAHDRYALDGGLVRLFREQGFSVFHLISLNHEHCLPPTPGRGALLRAWLPTLLASGLTESKLTGLLLRGGYRPPGMSKGPDEPASLSQRGWDTWYRSSGRSSPSATRRWNSSSASSAIRPTWRSGCASCGNSFWRGSHVPVPVWTPSEPRSNTSTRGKTATRPRSRWPGSRVGCPPAKRSRSSVVSWPTTHRTPRGSAEARLYREKTYDIIRRLHNVSHGVRRAKGR